MPTYHVRVLGEDQDLFTTEWHQANHHWCHRSGNYRTFEADNEDDLLRQINALLPEIYDDEVPPTLIPSVAPFPVEQIGEKRYRAALMDIDEYLDGWTEKEWIIHVAISGLEPEKRLLAIGCQYDPVTSLLDNMEHDLNEQATYFEWEPANPAYIPRTLQGFRRDPLYREGLLDESNGIYCDDGSVRYSSIILEEAYTIEEG